jgi:hypothetical protein
MTRGQAWVDLLMLANHNEGFIRVRGIRVPLSRGQVGWSEVKLAERWKWSRGKVRRYLGELEVAQQIFRQTKQEQGVVTSVITVTNWDLYQLDETGEGEVGGTASDTADGQQTEQQTDSKRDPIKKDKKVEKEKKSTPARRRKTQLPEEFRLTDAMTEYATKQGIQEAEVRSIFEDFGNYHQSKGTLMLDWTKAWYTWCRNHIRFQGKSVPVTKIEPKSGLPYKRSIKFDDINWEKEFIGWISRNMNRLKALGRQKAKKEIVIGHQETVGKHLDGKHLDLVLERIGLKDEAPSTF